MISILFCGVSGRMGRAFTELCAGSDTHRILCGVDPVPCESAPFPVFPSIGQCTLVPDVIVDFSHHSALPGILEFAKEKNVPAVICTTGHTSEEMQLMREASASVPVFFSRNMSVGINLLIELTRKAAAVLGSDFDVEIVEAHHNQKLDAPSGTALMIADAAASSVGHETEYVYDRHSVRRKRDPSEIGIHSIRGGTIVGQHTVIFAGRNEEITISHQAESRAVFAGGALRAAAFIIGKEPGMYDMSDVVSEIV